MSESCVQDSGAERLRAAGLISAFRSLIIALLSTPSYCKRPLSLPSTPAAELGPLGQRGEVHHFEKHTQFREGFSSQPMEKVL